MRRALALTLVMTAALSTAHAEKKRTTAQALSGIGAGVSSAMILAAFIVSDGTTYYGSWEPGHVNHPLLYAGFGVSLVSPSLGEYYAGQYLTIGEGVRAAAAALALAAIAKGETTARCETIDDPTVMCKAFSRTGVVLLSIAAIAYVGGVAYDVMDASDAVDRFNSKHGIIIVPTASTTGAGLAISGRF
ncbi:MAG TPA: hypothetical protein VGO00_13685 [Kofleriaceae bacterium]|jgi:hypothetical protein|nr:hypothetical protein [Kofleriaceae bacterium]